MPFGFEERADKYDRDNQIISPENKEYLDVTYINQKDGNKVPVSFTWHEKEIKIDKVIESVKGISRKISTSGMRYRCKTGNKDYYLIFDGRGWYIEK